MAPNSILFFMLTTFLFITIEISVKLPKQIIVILQLLDA